MNRPMWEDYLGPLTDLEDGDPAALERLSEVQAQYIMDLDTYVTWLENERDRLFDLVYDA